MSLRRFTDKCKKYSLALLVLSALVLAGCATGPGSKRVSSTKDMRTGPDGRLIGTRDVPSKAQTLYEQAVAAMAAGDIIDAELRFQEFLLRYPDYPGGHVNLAIIFAGRGDDKAVEDSLTDALILDPEHPVALNQLGMLLRRQGKFLEAESAYLKAVTASPGYALAHYNLGVLNDLYLQRLDAALRHYERYQALAGEDHQVTKWIVDLKRRIGVAQRTANVTG
ncbi:MAG: tetratricopeptide repeat protein [Proteobacteria bacterium]|nr:tetratricopeptide repeat protein [Pseudomonadota bacterium]